MKFISNSESETMNFARNLAKKLHKGDVVVLSGDLGSGKTKFVEGFLSNFNLQDEISSPTFDNGICLIEWGEIIEDALPPKHITIEFERDEISENKRILNISTYGGIKIEDISDWYF